MEKGRLCLDECRPKLHEWIGGAWAEGLELEDKKAVEEAMMDAPEAISEKWPAAIVISPIILIKEGFW